MKILKKQKGFTVIEMLVVASIMVLLLVVTVVNFRGFEKSQIVETETEKLASVLRQAQVWTLVGQTVSETRYNYGVHLEECTALTSCYYTIFRDIDWDARYDVGEEVTGRTYTFLTGVYIGTLDPQDSEDLDILFIPPLANVYFNGLDISEAQISIVSNLSSNTNTITINQVSGQIEIE
jgi:prepilin-type N-terminal cleavage/methylation domain-containing protein